MVADALSYKIMANLRVFPLFMEYELRALHANLEIDDEGQMVATWQVKPLLTDQIKIPVQNDEKYQKLMEEARDGKKPRFSVTDDGLLLHQGRVCIPNDVELRHSL